MVAHPAFVRATVVNFWSILTAILLFGAVLSLGLAENGGRVAPAR
jgi:hypothetical protein